MGCYEYLLINPTPTPITHEYIDLLFWFQCIKIPQVEAGKNTLPGNKTPLPGLHLCGDYTIPVIGVPATAASGDIATNNLISVSNHWNMLDKITPYVGQEGDYING